MTPEERAHAVMSKWQERVMDRAVRIVRSFPMFHRTEATDEDLAACIAGQIRQAIAEAAEAVMEDLRAGNGGRLEGHPRRLVELTRLAASIACEECIQAINEALEEDEDISAQEVIRALRLR